MNIRLRRLYHAPRAVTLTELLVVLAIIGLLATIVIPVYLTRMEQARIRTAQLECKEIALAEEQCAIIHGFFVPIQLLNDLIHDDRGLGFTATPPADSLDNELLSNIHLIDPFVPAIVQAGGNQFNMGQMNVARVFDMVMHWQGPFLNVHRKYINPAHAQVISRDDVRFDFPIDPWGQPYRFFSPIGPIGDLALVVDINQMFNDSFSNGRIQTAGSTTHDPFDRYTIVSYGPNQILDLRSEPTNDDIFYEFGTVIDTSTFYRFLR